MHMILFYTAIINKVKILFLLFSTKILLYNFYYITYNKNLMFTVTTNNRQETSEGGNNIAPVNTSNVIKGVGLKSVGSAANSELLNLTDNAANTVLSVVGNTTSGSVDLVTKKHDPVTIGTANGLSLSGQQISLANATTSANGSMLSTDRTFLNLYKTCFYINSNSYSFNFSPYGYNDGSIIVMRAILTVTAVNSDFGADPRRCLYYIFVSSFDIGKLMVNQVFDTFSPNITFGVSGSSLIIYNANGYWLKICPI